MMCGSRAYGYMLSHLALEIIDLIYCFICFIVCRSFHSVKETTQMAAVVVTAVFLNVLCLINGGVSACTYFVNSS